MLRIVLLVAATLAMAAACGGDDDSGDDAQGEIEAKVAFVYAQAGSGAVYGHSARPAVDLALEEINEENAVPSVRLEAIFADDGSDPDQAAEVFRQMIEDEEVSAIVGPTLSNVALVVDPIAQEAGVPVVGPTNSAPGIPQIGDYIFRTSLSEAVVTPVALEAAIAAYQPETAAIIYGSGESSRRSADVLRQAALEHGLEILVDVEAPAGTEDFRPALEQVVTANPDLLILSLSQPGPTFAVTQARALGLTQPIVGTNAFNTPQFPATATSAAEGVIVAAGWNVELDNPPSRAFVEKYRDRYGDEPDQFAAQAYAAVYVLAKAVQDAGSSDRDAIREALAALDRYETVLGTFSFDAEGEPTYPPLAQVVQDGRFVLFDVETAAVGGYIY